MGKKKITRAVIDTNVFISSLLFEGVAKKLVECWQKGKFIFLISKPILEEYIKVLSYPKFELSQDEIKEIIVEELLPFVEIVVIKKSVSIIKEDPFDNIFLSTALEGKADFIVSGDRHLLDLKEYRGIRIIELNNFLGLIIS